MSLGKNVEKDKVAQRFLSFSFAKKQSWTTCMTRNKQRGKSRKAEAVRLCSLF